MIKKKFKIFLATALAIGMLTSTSITPAFASSTNVLDNNSNVIEVQNEENTLTEKDKSEVDDWMKSNGVKKDTRESLIEKLEDGEVWDSMNSSSPVKVEKLDKSSIKETYADGSILIKGMEDVPVRTLRSLSGGETSSGSGYQNVKGKKVYVYGGTINAQFYADYTLVNNGYDYISKVYNKKVVGVGMVASNVDLGITQTKENGNGPAEATLDFEITSIGGWAGGNGYLKLFVGNDEATSDWSI